MSHLFDAPILSASHVEESGEFIDDSDALSPVPVEFTPFDNCIANALNRSVPTSHFGAFTMSNLPVDEGLFRIRITCTQNGVTLQGQTQLLSPVTNGTTPVGSIILGVVEPIADSLTITTSKSTLTSQGDTAQLTVTAFFDNGTQSNVTFAPDTTYTTSNQNIAQVSSTGLVIAQNSGIAILSASKDGVISTILITVTGGVGGDSDSDGMPDSFEIANGLNPNDPSDAGLDPDSDGLTNLQEFLLGTSPKAADSDGDGIADGKEIFSGCNPLIAEITTAVGRIIDGFGGPIQQVKVSVLGRTDLSDANGIFTILNVPACPPKAVRAVATANIGGIRLKGLSAPLLPVVGGTTNLGDIMLISTNAPLYPGPKFPAGFGSVSMRVADLNSDGVPDLVTANFPSNDVSVLLGNGDGTFQSEQRFFVGFGPKSLAVADINEDGIPDLVTLNDVGGFSNVSILLGNGNGTFQDRQSFFVFSNSQLEAIADINIADLNVDGHLDIIIPNKSLNTVSVFLGNGNSTFQARMIYAVDFDPVSAAVSDLNSDGIPDLVIVNSSSNNISVLLGNGDGTFQGQQLFTVGTTPGSVVVADINVDGFPDIVTANNASHDVSVLLGTGNGTFQGQQRFAVGSGPQSVTMADVDSDGLIDILTANLSSDDVSVLLGNGNGTFLSELRFAVGGSIPHLIAIADVNGDGLFDIVTANGGSRNVSVLLQQ